jgi:hypothetical protein
MAQHDYSIANQSGASFRADLNNALSAIVSQNSGSSEPSTTYAYMPWADTTTGLMKMRNGANSAWITLYQLDGEWNSIALENGTAAAPSIYFRSSGTDTGFFSGGIDQVNISTGGTERVEWGTSEVVFNDAGNNYDFRVEGDTNTHLLFVDASADAIGVGTSSPQTLLDARTSVSSTAEYAGVTFFENTLNNVDTNPTTAYPVINITRAGKSGASYRSSAALGIARYENPGTQARTRLDFSLAHGDVAAPDVTVMSLRSDGRVGVGTTSPGSFVGSVNVTIGSAATTTTTAAVNIYSGNATYGGLYFADGTVGDQLYRGSVEYKHDVDALAFGSAGTERARIDSSGRLLLGTSSARTSASHTASIQLEGTSFSAATLSVISDANDSSGSYIHLGKARGGSIGSTGVVQNGDALGQIHFTGSDGTSLLNGALIGAYIDGAPGSNDLPTRLVFSTTADGASSPTERMRIEQNGNISIGIGGSTTYRTGISVPSGADRDILLASVTGVTNGLQVNYVNSGTALVVRFNSITTTASAANAFLDSADGNRIYRSTSSLRYKTDIENVEQIRSDAVLGLRPVWYRSKAADDRQDWSWYGLIAEEVAEVEPRLVHWTYLDDDYDVETVNGEIKKTPKEGAQMVPDGVQYDRLTVLLLDVVKRQQQAIEALETKVAALEAQ